MITRSLEFALLPASDRWLLVRAFVLVAAVRVALWILPFQWVTQLTESCRPVSPKLAAIPVNRLSWAVQAAARRIPGASCLTQALALARLLARAGHCAALRIGVAKDAARGFEAHAWVECGGTIAIGDIDGLDRYAPILALSIEKR